MNTHVNKTEAKQRLINRQPFRHRTLRAHIEGNLYVVHSYGVKVLVYDMLKASVVIRNLQNMNSAVMAKHQHLISQVFDK